MNQQLFVVRSTRGPRNGFLRLFFNCSRSDFDAYPKIKVGDEVDLLTVDGKTVMTTVAEFNPVFIDPIDLPYLTFSMLVRSDVGEKSNLLGARIQPTKKAYE